MKLSIHLRTQKKTQRLNLGRGTQIFIQGLQNGVLRRASDNLFRYGSFWGIGLVKRANS